jgi:polyphosphate kinase
MRFLGIYSNNMDEFFRVRVASVRRLIALGQKKIEGFNGGPSALLKEIRKRVLEQQQLFELSYQKLLVEFKRKTRLFLLQKTTCMEKKKNT